MPSHHAQTELAYSSSQPAYPARRRLWIGVLIIAASLIALVSIAAAWIVSTIAPTFVWDSNFDLFQNHLDESQRMGIQHSVRGTANLLALLVTLTNVCWLALLLLALLTLRPRASRTPSGSAG